MPSATLPSAPASPSVSISWHLLPLTFGETHGSNLRFCITNILGPALSGTLVELVGFEGLIITTALICFGFAPLLLLLRNPPARQVNEAQIQEQAALRYVNYSHLDSPDEEAQLSPLDQKTRTYVR